MAPWILFAFLFLVGSRWLFAGFSPVGTMANRRRDISTAKAAERLLFELQETVEAGLVPSESRWHALSTVGRPWGPLAAETLSELRASGASILPTIRRLRGMAEDYVADRANASARTAQAMMQAVVCALLVPVFGFALYRFLPGAERFAVTWFAACVLAMTLSFTSTLWMLSMAERAGWGGLSPARRGWVLAALCLGERVLALVRSGVPADLAWARSVEMLMRDHTSLAEYWGADVWTDGAGRRKSESGSLEAVLIECGSSIKRAIQSSIAEGRPCTERLETLLRALRTDMRAAVDREVGLLGTRALKPLFLLVAPSLFGLVAAGGYLTWIASVS